MPRTIRTILCPLNLRHAAIDHQAYSEAVEMARRHAAKLIVATVAPEIERNLNIRDSERYWTDQLARFMKVHPAEGVEVETIVRKGAVHRQIVKLADQAGVDVIVMQAANPRITDYLLGTTATHVVAHAECSVYVVRNTS